MQRLTHTRGDSLLERGSKHTQTHTPCMVATVTLNRSESGRGDGWEGVTWLLVNTSVTCVSTHACSLLTGIVSANVAHAHAHPLDALLHFSASLGSHIG